MHMWRIRRKRLALEFRLCEIWGSRFALQIRLRMIWHKLIFNNTALLLILIWILIRLWIHYHTITTYRYLYYDNTGTSGASGSPLTCASTKYDASGSRMHYAWVWFGTSGLSTLLALVIRVIRLRELTRLHYYCAPLLLPLLYYHYATISALPPHWYNLLVLGVGWWVVGG
jgi:hypothetical protein